MSRIVLVVAVLCSWSTPLFAWTVPLNDRLRDCASIPCQNGGACVLPPTTTFMDNTTTTKHAVCQCPTEFEGQFCERRRRQRHRQTQEVSCGPITCYNGGQCIQEHLDDYDTHPKPLCDCGPAFTVVPDPFNTNHELIQVFVGPTCEFAVPQEAYCTRNTNNDDFFCLNNGKCRLRAQNFAQQPCRCPDGYTGRHCEYSVKEGHVVEECALDCNGHGLCVHGASPFSNQGANAVLDVALAHRNPLQDSSEAEQLKFMYCACDIGYAGTNCEYRFTKCNGQRKYCFHGSTCIEDEGPHQGECECQTSPDGPQLAGEMCEFHATDVCQQPKTPSSPSSLSPGMRIQEHEFPFCVNNGVCVEDGAGDYFCECDEAHYTGKRCETIKERTVAPHETARVAPSASPSTWEPTYLGSATEYPTYAETPSNGTHPSPPTDGVDSSLTMSSSSKSPRGGMSGAGKFGLTLFVLVLVVSVVAVGYRYYHQQWRSGKETVANDNHNLQLDMISEETNIDENIGQQHNMDGIGPGGEYSDSNTMNSSMMVGESPTIV